MLQAARRLPTFLFSLDSITKGEFNWKVQLNPPDMKGQAAIALLPIVPERLSGSNATLFAAQP